MKPSFSFLIILFIGFSISAQSFEFEPDNNRYSFKLGNENLYQLVLNEGSGITTHTSLLLNSEEGPMASIGLNSDENGELKLFNFGTSDTTSYNQLCRSYI